MKAMEKARCGATERVPLFLGAMASGFLYLGCAQSDPDTRNVRAPVANPSTPQPFSQFPGEADDDHGAPGSAGSPAGEGEEAEPWPGVGPDNDSEGQRDPGEDGRDEDGTTHPGNGVSPVSRVPADQGAANGPQGHGQTDRDHDGIWDKFETNTGIMRSDSDLGTDPDNEDTDGDGLWDGDEVYGTREGLDLPAMGVSPLHRDLLVEYDWIDDSSECGAHSHKPSLVALERMKRAFANAPVSNPDKRPGIQLIQDYGQSGLFSGGTLVTNAGILIEGEAPDPSFQSYMDENMDPKRRGYFHYALMGHRYRYYDQQNNPHVDSSGNGELPGDGFMVTLHCAGSDSNVANTIMHELGHNLGLRHGGDEEVNWKPNYNSVMNYLYQFAGVDTDCSPGGDAHLDYSSNTRMPLDENALFELNGICGGEGWWWDWNGDKVRNAEAIAYDVNEDESHTVLEDVDDWGLIVKNKTLIRVAVASDSSSTPCPPPPDHQF